MTLNPKRSPTHRRANTPAGSGNIPRTIRPLPGRGTFETGSDENMNFNSFFKQAFPKLSTKYEAVQSRVRMARRREDSPPVLGVRLPPPQPSPDTRLDAMREFAHEDKCFRAFLQSRGGQASDRPRSQNKPREVASPHPAGNVDTSFTTLLKVAVPVEHSTISSSAQVVPPPRVLTPVLVSPLKSPTGTSLAPLSLQQPSIILPHYKLGKADVEAPPSSPMHSSRRVLHRGKTPTTSATRRSSVSSSYGGSAYDNVPRQLKKSDNGYDNEYSSVPSSENLDVQGSLVSVLQVEQPQEEIADDLFQASSSAIIIDEDQRRRPRSRRALGSDNPHSGIADEIDPDACDRDWNEAFQALIEKNCMTPYEASERARKIKELQDQFQQAVLPVANVILRERDAPTKTIPTVDAGGKAGGDKYIVGNVFFKFCNTPYTEKLYGGFENSMKSATHELQGVNAFVAANVKRLRVPLCMVITYHGQRLWVSTLIPVDKNSLRYGSQDAGRTVRADDKAFALMRTVARVMNIKGHYVGARDAPNLTLLFGPVDIEVHLAADARLYVIDTARIFPPDPNIPWRDNDKFYMFCQLRAEFVAAWEVPLSSDAWSPFGHSHRHVHDEEVRRAAKHLVEVLIPGAVGKIAYTLLGRLEATQRYNSSIALTAEMHRYGINMRYLGLLLESFILVADKSPSKYAGIRQSFMTHVVAEILARSIKVQFLLTMRRIPTTAPQRTSNATCDFFNSVFQGTPQSGDFYKRELIPMIVRKFNPGLKGRAMIETVWFRESLSPELNPAVYALTLQRASVLCGVQWNIVMNRDLGLIYRLGKGTENSPLFTTPLLRAIHPIIKLSEISPFANVMKLIENGQLEEAERIYAQEIQNRELILGDCPKIVPLLDSLASLYTHPGWTTTQLENNRLNDLIQTRKRIVKIFQDVVETEEGKKETENFKLYVKSLINLGGIYFSMNEYQEAGIIFTTAYDLAAEHLSTASVVLGQAYFWSGRLHEVYGRFQEALKHYDVAVTVCGTRDPEVPAFLESVWQSRAKLHFALENTKLATEDVREALSSIRSRLDDSSPSVAICKGVVASIIYQKNPEEAIELCNEAMQVVRGEYGAKSQQMALLLATLSRATLHAGHFEEGYRFCEESLSMQQLLGSVGIGVADTLVLLAKFFFYPYHERQLEAKEHTPLRLNSAKAYLMQAKDIYNQLLKNPKHPNVARINTMLCDLHRILRQPQESLLVGKEALLAFQSHQLFYPDVADAMVALGRAYCAIGRHMEATQLYYQALGLYEESGCSYFLVVELLGQCLPHTRPRQAPPLARYHVQAAKLDVTLRLVGFFLHHKHMGNASFFLREAMNGYKDLFPAPLPFNPSSERFLNMFLLLVDERSLSRLPRDDVLFQDMIRFVESEENRRKGHVAHTAQQTIDRAREEEMRHKTRQHAKIDSIIKQIRHYSGMGKSRNALTMFVSCLEIFSLLWPQGALPNDETSMGMHNKIIECLEQMKPHIQSEDKALFFDTSNYVQQCLGTNVHLDDEFLRCPLENFTFLRRSSAAEEGTLRSWVQPQPLAAGDALSDRSEELEELEEATEAMREQRQEDAGGQQKPKRNPTVSILSPTGSQAQAQARKK